MFFGAKSNNIAKAMQVWDKFAIASGLKINKRNLDALQWPGAIVLRDVIFCHLGYPIEVHVTPMKLLDWTCSRIVDKFSYWKSQFWPFHVRMKVVQSILIPMVLYYLPLLPWMKKAIARISSPMYFMLWKRKHTSGILWMAWDHLCTPKRLGGAALLNLYDHMAAHRFSFFIAMFKDDQPWVELMKLL